MKSIAAIVSLLSVLLLHNLGFSQNIEGILPRNQGTFFTQTIQLRQGVGVRPSVFAITPNGRKIVVVDDDSAANAVDIIDLGYNNVVSIIPFERGLKALSITPDGRKAVVANEDADKVSIIDLKNDNIVAVIPVGRAPRDLIITPDGRKAVVAISSDKVSIIDLENNNVIATIPVGDSPRALASTSDGRKAVVANLDTVSIIDLENNNVIETISAGYLNYAPAITSDGKRAVVRDEGGFFIIDLENYNVITIISVETSNYTITPDGRKAVVADWESGTVRIIDIENNNVITTIPVGDNLLTPAITPDGRKAVVASYNGTVYIIDLGNNKVTATIPIGDLLETLAITPDGRKAVVAILSDMVSIIDLENNNVIATIPVYGRPQALAITSDGREAVATNWSTKDVVTNLPTMSIIDLENNNVTATISAGDRPRALAITPNGRKAVVANTVSDTVSIIDLENNHVIATIPVGHWPSGLAITPDGRKAVVYSTTNSGSGQLSIIDLENNNVIATIPVEGGAFAITPDGRKAVIASYNAVYIIDLESNSVIATIPVGGDYPMASVITSDGRKAVVYSTTNSGSGQLSIIDLENNNVIATIPVEGGDFAITPDGRKAVIASYNAVYIRDLENNSVIATVPVEGGALVITPDGRKAVVASYNGTVYIIDLGNNKVIATIVVGDSPYFVAITPDGRKAVVTKVTNPAGWGDDIVGLGTVSIIDLDTSKVMKSIKVGRQPAALAITPDGSKVLVANSSSQNISIIREIGTITLANEFIDITNADEPSTVTATVYDPAGKPVKDIPIIFTSTNPNIVLAERGAVTDAHGKASAVLTPLRQGTANIFAQFDDLRSNLATVHVAQDFGINPELSGKPFSLLLTVIPDFTGCKSIGRVTVLNAYGDPIPNTEVEINAIKATMNEAGVAAVELCLGGSSSVTVSATAAGIESEKIFFDFSLPPQSIEAITFTPSSLSLTEGDPLLGGTPVRLTARVSPPQKGLKVNFFSTDPRVADVVERSGVTDDNGEVALTVLPKVAGSCELIAQASRFVSQPIPVEVEKIRVSEVRIEGDKPEIMGGGGGPTKVGGEALSTKAGGGPLLARSSAHIEPRRALLQANDGGTGPIITAAVFPPQEGVEVRFTIDRPQVASVEIRTFTDASGIATARVDFISDGEATITAHVVRAPTSNPTQEKAVGIIPPSVLGSVIEAISQMGMDGARVSILEEPERGAMTTTGGGSFWIQAIRRAHASFKVEAEGYFNRVEQLNLLSLPEQVVFPLTQDRFWTEDQAVNNPPVANAQSVTTAEDTPVSITLTGSDPDGDPLTFAVVTQPAHGILSGTAPNLTYTPSANYNGADSFTFRVSDGTANSTPATVSLTVSSVNDAPVLASIGDKSVNEGQLLTFTISASDVDGDALTHSASNLPSGASFDPSTRTFSWTPTYAQAGNYPNVQFQVSDGTLTDSEAITITVNNTNRPPTANTQAVTTNEDTPVSITLTGSDSDGDALTFTVVNPPAHGTLSGTAPDLTYIPAANYNGADSFTFRVSDGTANSTPATVSLTVTPVNDAPVLAPIGNKGVNEGQFLTFTLSASDVDGDTPTYSASNLPLGASFDPATRTFSWTPTYAQAGNYPNVQFQVSDGTLTDSEAITITVNNINRAPTANAQAVTTNEDAPTAITLTGSDPDGNSLTFTVVTQPAHGTLSGTAPNLTYTPSANYNGADSFTFKVNDGTIDSNPATVSLTVSEVNDAPTANAQSVTTAEDTPVSITLTGSDPDGDPLTFMIVTHPAHGTLSGTAPNLTYAPAANYHGADSFTFRVSDGTVDSNPATASLTVTPVNDAPVLAPIGNKNVNEGQFLTFTLSANDVDGDTLTYSASNLPLGASFDPSTRTFSWTPTYAQSGTYPNVRFEVSDGSLTNSEEITIHVIASAEMVYQYLYRVIDRYQTGDIPRLLESYTATPTFASQENVAYLYDSNLALWAFLEGGSPEDLSYGRAIADALVMLQQNDPLGDGRLRDAYPADSLVDEASKVRLQLASSHTGNLAWTILSLLRYHQAQGGQKYREAAVRLGEWVVQNVLDNQGAGGFTGGIDDTLQPIRWKSTEHNLDLYAAFMRLYGSTGEKRWLGWADHARSFVKLMWDAGEAHFWTGTLSDGVTINREPIPLDGQAAAVLALGKGYAGSLTWAQKELRMDPCECGQLKGYRFSTGGTGCWFEGTGPLSMALRVVGEEDNANTLLGELREVQTSASNGDGSGIVAACSDGVETGYGWSYYNALHVGASAWYLLAARGVNPLEVPAISIGPSVSGKIQDFKKLPVSGVRVEARETDGALVGVGLTDAQGNYRLELPAGRYTLTPRNETHLFSPASQRVTVKIKDLGRVNFTVKLLTLSGSVKDRKGRPLAGVTILLRQGETTVANTRTNAKGNYSFSLNNTGTYTVEPSQTGSYFAPGNVEVTLTKENRGGINFKEVP